MGPKATKAIYQDFLIKISVHDSWWIQDLFQVDFALASALYCDFRFDLSFHLDSHCETMALQIIHVLFNCLVILVEKDVKSGVYPVKVQCFEDQSKKYKASHREKTEMAYSATPI